MVLRQAVGIPVAAILASPQGVVIVVVVGYEVEDVVLVDDVVVGGRGWRRQGDGYKAEEG